jgi:hypothetical protein
MPKVQSYAHVNWPWFSVPLRFGLLELISPRTEH